MHPAAEHLLDMCRLPARPSLKSHELWLVRLAAAQKPDAHHIVPGQQRFLASALLVAAEELAVCAIYLQGMPVSLNKCGWQNGSCEESDAHHTVPNSAVILTISAACVPTCPEDSHLDVCLGQHLGQALKQNVHPLLLL